MSKKIKYTFGNESFSTKEEVKTRCRGIIATGVVTPTDRLFLEDLFSYHPNFYGKSMSGIAAMYVGKDDRFGGPCFRLRRQDGSDVDWSFHLCIDQPSQARRIHKACRDAIVPQIRAFRETAFGDRDWIPSAISNEPVTRDTCHVDHQAPATFKALVDQFLDEHQFTLETVPFSSSKDGIANANFIDPALREAWPAFHQSRAVLRIVTVQENLRLK